MATVHKAEMTGADGYSRTVALKLIEGPQIPRPKLEQWFIGEARLGGKLLHHNIVATLDYGVEEGQRFLVMEYVDGPTLHQILSHHRTRNEKIPVDVVLQMMSQACAGLQYAHTLCDEDGAALNVVHRDLKPSNILLTRHGLIKIADFGIAHWETELATTKTGEVKGTPHYMSPEQAWGRREIDYRSDLYALGVVLHELLTLEHYFQGESREELHRRAQDGEGTVCLEHLPPGEVGEALQQILARALAFVPEQRYQSAREMSGALEAVLSTLPQPQKL